MQNAQPPATSQYPAIRPKGRRREHLYDYFETIMKHYLWVVLATFLSVLIAVVITQRQPRLYRATATLEIIPPWMTGSSDVVQSNILSDDRYLATQLDKLRMPSVIEKAVKNSNLTSLKDFKGKDEKEIVKMVAGRVSVALRRNQYLVDVSISGENAAVLDELCNAIVENFRVMQRGESKNRRDNYRRELESQLESARSAVSFLTMDKTNELQGRGFTEQTFEAEEENLRKRLGMHTERRDTVDLQRIEDRDTADQFKDALEKGDEAVQALSDHPFMLDHPVVQQLNDAIFTLQERQRTLVVQHGRGKNDKEYMDLQADVQGLTAQRERKIRAIVSQFVRSYLAAGKKLEDLDTRIIEIQSKLEQNAGVKNNIDHKNAEIERHQEAMKVSQRELERLAAVADDERDTVRVTQRAAEPKDPYSPNKVMNFTLGLVLGLAGGIALAFLRDYLDDTVRNKDELAALTPDVPLLGIVPNIDASKREVQKKDLYAYNKPKSTISEAYRGVRTALTLSSSGKEHQALLLTSAGPKEGKTTTSINLATVLGYSGARTLLIDADLRKPRIHKSFDRLNTTGLTTAIVDGGDPLDHVQSTDIERVDLMPSGPIPPNPSELLGRPRMREILDELRKTYDYIVMDTPPIGAVTDAAVLAKAVDGVILVVHAGRTRRQIVSRGIEQLHQINATITGVILNNLKLGRARYYPGYYHYYYYYTSYYGADERSVRGKGKKDKKGKAAKTEPAGGSDNGAGEKA